MDVRLAEKQSPATTESTRPPTRWLYRIDALSPRTAVSLLVFSAILVRLIFVFAAPGIGDPNSMDAQNYLGLARNMVEGHGFVLYGVPSAFVAPLYPMVVAGLMFVFGDSIWFIKVFQAVLGGTTAWLVYLLGRALFNQRVAYIAAALFALHPEMIAISAYIYTEVFFIFLLLLTLLPATEAMKTGKIKYFLIVGMLLGITNLCRGTLMYFPAFLFLLLLFYRDQCWLGRLSGLAVLMLAMALTMLPWSFRNYKEFHVFLPVATGGGDVFWNGNYLPFDGEFRYERSQRKINELIGDAPLIERDRILMAEAKKNILAQPVESAWLFVRKIFRYWFRVYKNIPTGQSRETNWLIFSVLGTVHFALLALAITGFWHTNFREPIVGVVLTLFFYYTLIHAATLAVPRYRQPLIPVLCIFAAAGALAIRPKWYLSERSK